EIIDLGNGQESNNIVLAHEGTGRKLAYYALPRTGDYVVYSHEVLEEDVCSHVAVTVDADGNTTLYKNGAPCFSGKTHLPPNLRRTKCYIGQSNWARNGHFEGAIADVRIWTRARTQAELRTDMYRRLKGDEKDLAGYWPLNETKGNKALDLSPNKKHGTIHGCAWDTAPFPGHPMARFDQSNKSHMIVKPFKVFPSNDLTIEFWVKTDHHCANNGSLVSYVAPSHLGAFLIWCPRGLQIYVNDLAINTSVPLPEGEWCHFALSRNCETGLLRLYLDGGEVWNGVLSKGKPYYKNGTLTLGQKQDVVGGGFKAGNAFRGEMADVRIWNHVRTPAEIQAHRQHRLNGNEPGLVAYWPLDEAGGDVGADKSPNARDGALHDLIWEKSCPIIKCQFEGTVDKWIAAEQQAAEQEAADLASLEKAFLLKFDGKDDYVELPSLNFDYSKGFTIEAWVRFETLSRNWIKIVDFGRGQENNNIILAKSDERKIAYVALPRTGSYSLNSHNIIEEDVCCHLAVTVDADGQTVLYKNGDPFFSGETHLPPNMARTKCYIGRGNWASDAYFEGAIADVRVWTRPRTRAEIMTDMYRRLDGTEKDLAGYWPLNETKGNKALDLSPNKKHGTIHGCAWDAAPFPGHPMPRFDGSNKSHMIAKPFKGFPTTDFTVEFWVKTDHHCANNGSLFCYVAPGHLGEFLIWLPRGLQIYVHDHAINTSVPLPEGEWCHFALSRNCETGLLRLYIDGGEVWNGTQSKGDTLNGNGSLTLGQKQDVVGGGFNAGNAFRGQMADVRIWNHVRTMAEIQAHRQHRLTGDEDGLVAYWPLDEEGGDIGNDKSPNAHNGAIHDLIWEKSCPIVKCQFENTVDAMVEAEKDAADSRDVMAADVEACHSYAESLEHDLESLAATAASAARATIGLHALLPFEEDVRGLAGVRLRWVAAEHTGGGRRAEAELAPCARSGHTLTPFCYPGDLRAPVDGRSEGGESGAHWNVLCVGGERPGEVWYGDAKLLKVSARGSCIAWCRTGAADAAEGPLLPPRAGHASAFVGGARVVVFGGYDGSDDLGDTHVLSITETLQGPTLKAGPLVLATHSTPLARSQHTLVSTPGVPNASYRVLAADGRDNVAVLEGTPSEGGVASDGIPARGAQCV
ncbi:MAG: LamG-like jellyroll fold domain-containing protein, partial [Verrucomicrobiota bacterium]